MLITVKQEHIDAGVRGDACNCPVALAIREVDKRKFFVNSDHVSLLISGSTNFQRFKNPPFTTFFIGEFDQGRPVEPFTFNLEGL